MNELLKILLSLSLSGSLLILILFLCKPLYQNRLSRQWQYYIWLVVLIRLLLPAAPETSLVGKFFQSLAAVEQADSVLTAENGGQAEPNGRADSDSGQAGQAPSDPNSSGDSTPSGLTDEKETEASSEPVPSRLRSLIDTAKQNIGFLCLLVWLMTAIALLIRKITIYQSFITYLRAGRIEVTDLALWERIGKLAEQSGGKRTVRLYTNSLISSPLLIGFFRPCIMLPSAELPDPDFQFTILHELTHDKRRDMFYKWLVQITICIHWFNPLVYRMGREINRACELSCDEAVIRMLDAQGRLAYGNTLLRACAPGNYKNSLASMTLNENRPLLKERLDAIMNFKRKSGLCTAVSVILTIALCFGATVTGAYAAPSPAGSGETSAAQPKRKNISLPKQKADGSLTRMKKEYSAADIKSLRISGIVVEALSENVSVTRGGTTLKVEYYVKDPDDYTLQNESDGGGTFEELVLRRVSSAAADKAPRPISITIPETVNFKLVSATTDTGDITLTDCSADTLLTETQSGTVRISGGLAAKILKVETDSGTALISGTVLPERDYSVAFETESGAILFQPEDSVKYYHFIVDTGAKAQITVNGKKYKAGDFEINAKGKKKIYFDTGSGSLNVQDFSLGELTADGSGTQSSSASPDAQPAQAASPAQITQPAQTTTPVQAVGHDYGDLKLIKKEYTKTDLTRMGITGIHVGAAAENIVVSQGGSSLILEYYQSKDTDYTLGTREYEIYNEEFATPEEIKRYGGKSGKVKQLELLRENPPDVPETARTIHITLPSDSKYSRIVQLSADSGSIRIKKCTGAAMLDAETGSGNISIQDCSSPMLGAKTKNGRMTITGCSMEELNSQTQSGTLSLGLADRAQNYKMVIDTGAKAHITVNGKKYRAGEFILHKKASNVIYFDTASGTLEITEPAEG